MERKAFTPTIDKDYKKPSQEIHLIWFIETHGMIDTDSISSLFSVFETSVARKYERFFLDLDDVT